MEPEEAIEGLALQFPQEVDQASIKRLQAFLHKVVDKTPPRPETFWHYTSGVGLLGIIGTGTIFASHVSGLNDSMEYLYFAKLLHDEANTRLRALDVDFDRAIYQSVLGTLAKREAVSSGAFVTCFSTAKDDLGQWRGYGGDNCAFAIEFDGRELLERISKRHQTTWLRVIYDSARHAQIAAESLDYHVDNLKLLESQERIDAWIKDFGPFHQSLYDTLHAVIKHPKFEAEKEYRLFTKLLVGEDARLKFAARRSMITRRLELDWSLDGKLPIKSVMVGPAQSQEASRIAIGDLLKQKGYVDVPVDLSDIPYRMV